MNGKQTMTDDEVDDFLAVRKEAAKHIDPATTELCWGYRQVLDPYDVLDVSEEEYCVGRSYFARSPGSNIWVSFSDLSPELCKALWEQRPCPYERGNEYLREKFARLMAEQRQGPLQ